MIKRCQNSLGVILLLSLSQWLLVGCSDAKYYWQSTHGHLSLMSQREPIEDLLAGEHLSAERREALTKALAIRDYASERLGLPRNGSYRSYVELNRPYVVWSVVATEALSMRPKEHCFPLIGCVTYRGFFAEAEALAYAETLRLQGLDVHVGGVQAYSTLGWFDDPLISSMVDRGDILLAEVAFHELAHQQLYFADDTPFNEAFATLVGEYGVMQWLRDTNPDALPRYERWLQKKNDFVRLLQGTSAQLAALYASPVSEEEKRQGKGETIRQLSADYADLKLQWGGEGAYDKWFEQPVNNARLASVAVYRDLVPDFARWLDACGNDFSRFYELMGRWKGLDKNERQRKLRDDALCA